MVVNVIRETREPLTPAGKISRRAMVAGTVATTAVAAVLPLSNLAYAMRQDAGHDGLPVTFRGTYGSGHPYSRARILGQVRQRS